MRKAARREARGGRTKAAGTAALAALGLGLMAASAAEPPGESGAHAEAASRGPSAVLDTDADGVPNRADPSPYDPHLPGELDSDGDGIPNAQDPLPTVSDRVGGSGE